MKNLTDIIEENTGISKPILYMFSLCIAFLCGTLGIFSLAVAFVASVSNVYWAVSGAAFLLLAIFIYQRIRCG